MDKKKMQDKKQKNEEVLEKDNLQFEKYEKKIEELEDQLKRAVADYRNLERRSFEEQREAIQFANKHLVEALLPAFDTLFLAEKYTTDESVKLTIKRILEVLKDYGIEKVNSSNVKYNPETMEAVEVVEGEKDMVIEEIRPGFSLNNKLIRPAQVKVGKGKEEF